VAAHRDDLILAERNRAAEKALPPADEAEPAAEHQPQVAAE
jgi:hypothetical protein